MTDSTCPPAESSTAVCWPRQVGIACALVAILLLCWRGILDGTFHFDDYVTIVENRAVRSVWPVNHFLPAGRPAGLYSFALNYHFRQLDPRGYLQTNLLIHITNVLLLFTGIQLTGKLLDQTRGKTQPGAAHRNLSMAAGIALLWGLHPLTTQAVTYIVQRFESLATLGYLGAWVGMLLVIAGNRWGTMLVLLCAWIGLLSKQIFITAPVVILMFDRLVSGNTWRELLRLRWRTYLLMLTPVLFVVPDLLHTFDTSQPASAGFGLQAVSGWEYLRTQPEVILHYLRLAIWPEPLCFDYLWGIQTNPFVYLPLGAVILFLLGTGCWLFCTGLQTDTPNGQWRGLTGWFILSFFFVLAPTSSIIPISDLCVEHRMYLPLAIVMTGLFLAGNQIRLRLEASAKIPELIRTGFTLSLIACLTLLGWRTSLRNRDYHDGIRLWNTVLQIRPDNVRAYFLLANEYFGRGLFEQALPFYQQAVSYQLPFGDFETGLADCHRELGHRNDAARHYQRALKYQPNFSKAHNGLGVLLHQQGELDAARGSFQQAVDLNLPEARYNLAAVLIDLGEFAEAISLLEECLVQHPNFSLAARRLAWVLAVAPDAGLRDGPKAEKLLNNHFDLVTNNSPLVWDTYAAALAESGRFDAAITAAKKAIELAQNRKDARRIEVISRRLASYRQQRPWRESPSTNREPAEPPRPPSSGDAAANA